ncbi:hypothetical protein Trydic_g9829 [Trypoxylus dichotomus]
MSNEFELKHLGKAQYCLDIEFNIKNEKISLLQKGYIQDVLERFGMTDCKPVSTSLNPNDRLMKSIREPTEEQSKQPYRELVGALTYLSLCTRLDISFEVSYLAQFNDCHRNEHWSAAARVLRYLKGTMNLGIVYKTNKLDLRSYVDVDWGNSATDRRSYTGYYFILSGAAISWESKKQQTVALSTTQAEYMGLTEVPKEAIYLSRFLIELGVERLADVKIYNDNLSALRFAENPTYHARSKHIDIRARCIDK